MKIQQKPIYILLYIILAVGLEAKTVFWAADWQTTKTEIRSKNIPVYGFIGNKALILTDEESSGSFSKGKFPAQLLDSDVQPGSYYLVSSGNPNTPLILPAGIKALIQEQNTALVKGNQKFDLLRKLECEIFPLPEKPFILPVEELVAPELSVESKNIQITEVLSEVRTDSILSYLKYLQNMQTRFLHAPNRREVAEKVRLKFIELGCTTAVLDSFYLPAYTAYTDNVAYPATWQYNVVATITGSQQPDEFIIFGGHHDSIVLKPGQDPYIFAPGADDNGSSVAALWEICRAMHVQNYQPKRSIKFISFTAEEHGLLGSKDYADKVHTAGMKVKAMLNSDLIAYNLDTPENWTVRFIHYPAYPDLHKTAINITRQYTSLKTGVGGIENTRSDSYSFVLNGYPAIWYFENPFNPYYHSIQETWDKLDIPYCAEIIKAKCALGIYKNEAPENIRGLTVTDPGNGSQLLLKWKKSSDADLNHYKISVGSSSENYTLFSTTNDTVYTLSNLQDNQNYYIGISAVDNDGYESMIVEAVGTPNIVPVAPVQVTVESLWQGIKISWPNNQETDIAGYNIYRSQNSLDFVKINQNMISGTLFQDDNCNFDSYLYYKITAVDQTNNESAKSPASQPVRPITLDKGIMIIDDSPNGTGTAASPDDLMQDSFYSSITARCAKIANYDISENSGKLSLSELGPFSTVIWHNQSVELGSVLSMHQSEIKKYLDLGGKILLSADKPAKLLESCNVYPSGFSSSSLISAYFGADSANYKAASRFSGALPSANGYNYLEVDSAKALEANGFHIKKIETLHAKPSATIIYRYDSDYEATNFYGALKGQPVGLYYDGGNFKTVTLSVPLYFIEQKAAMQVVEYILKEKFGETVGIDNTVNRLPENLKLEQNYPNPFNPETIIGFNLSQTAKVKLTIYDIRGRELAILANSVLNSGRHAYRFSGADFASGVYFYRLQSENEDIVCKMILQK